MKKIEYVILISVLLVYAGLGLYYANSQGFWHDEVYTLTFLKGISAYEFQGSTIHHINTEFSLGMLHQHLAEDYFIENFSTQILHEGHPPLYFILLKMWSGIFGYSELALRSFSLICGIISILVLFTLVKKQFEGSKTAWYVLVILIANPFLFFFFSEARMYGLAFLLAVLAFKYWIRIFNEEYSKKNLALFVLFASLLLYTHYYGLFFLGTLGAISIVKLRFKRVVSVFTLPLLIFVPWMFVIPNQLDFHTIHWTDGAYGLGESFLGFCKGLLNLLVSPMSGFSLFEGIATTLIVILIIAFSRPKKKIILFLLIGFVIYFFQLFLFDTITDHHTIVVPRYYIFILIPLFWVIGLSISKLINYQKLILSGLLVSITTVSSYNVFSRNRAPKQMYREVGAYIDNNFSASNTLLVLEPRGSMAWGLSNYISQDFSIVRASDFQSEMLGSKRAVFIDEMLGVSFRENLKNNEEQENMKLVPFIGVFIYK